MGQGLVQGCATAGRRVQSYLVYVGHLHWGVHQNCADCGALLSEQPVKCDVPYGGPGTVGRFNDRYPATQVHSRTSAAEVARLVGYFGPGYCEPSYQGHNKTLRKHLVKALPWERDFLLMKQLLESTPHVVFTPGTDVHNAEYVRVIMWPHLKKVPLGSYAPYVIALLDFLRDPESETQLPDWLVSLLRKRGILNLPRHIEGLNCEQDE